MVWRAFDLTLRRPVAVKLLEKTDAVSLQRFEREGRATASLKHPGIVSVHDVGTHHSETSRQRPTI